MRYALLTTLSLLLACGSVIEQHDDVAESERAHDAGSVSERPPTQSTSSGASPSPDAGAATTDGRAPSQPPDATPPRSLGGLRDAGRAPRGCDDEEHWIHAIARTGMLLRYDPDQNQLSEIGLLGCPSASTPISMAVRRNGIAYVLYADGNLYEVDTEDASCRETSFAPTQSAFATFGMGFVSDQPNGEAETLYIAGGADDLEISPLAALETASWRIATVGELRGTAELTGNSKGELWAFLATASPMVVLELDKSSGTTLRRFDVSAVDRTSSATAWAFAYWGGRYYIFYEGQRDDSTSIYRLTTELDIVEPVYERTGYRIVGAGVSTCAPTLLI